MASKSRGGLSKRELAASQKAKLVKKPVSVVRKSASSAISTPKKQAIASNADGTVRYLDGTSSNPYASNIGESAGIVEARATAQDKGILPKVAPKKSSPSKQSSSSNSNRSKAASLVRSGLGIGTANASSEPNYTPASNTNNRSIAGAFTGINQGSSAFQSTPPVFSENSQISDENTNETFIGKGLRALNEAPRLFGGSSRLINGDLGISEALHLNQLLRNPQETVNSALGITTAQGAELASHVQDGTGGAESTSQAPVSSIFDNVSPQADTQPYSQEIQRQAPTTIDTGSGLGGGTGVGLGGGIGTGAGATGAADPQTDSYIQDLQDSVKGDFGAKDTQKQFKELIRGLDPEYDAYLKQAETELNKAKQEDLNKLAGVFAGYNTADSEQRLQQQERVQGDYANQLSGLLAKLMLQKQKDVTGYKSQLSERLAGISEAKQTAQQRVAQLIQDAQNTAWDRNYKMQSLKRGGGSAPKEKNMSLEPIQFDAFGNATAWLDQSTGNIYDQSSFFSQNNQTAQ